jgi:hypothetical protein
MFKQTKQTMQLKDYTYTWSIMQTNFSRDEIKEKHFTILL